MSWLEKGFSSLKGQITNFTKDVLSEEGDDTHGPGETSGAFSAAAIVESSQFTPAVLEVNQGSSHPDGKQQEHLKSAHDSDRGREHGFFGQALSGLPLASLPLFGRSEDAEEGAEDQQKVLLRQHCAQLEDTVQRLLAQLEELSEVRDKEALELATLKRELRHRGDDQSTGPGSTSGSGSPQLPDENNQAHGTENVGISPALSDDGFTKLDPSETELWEATQELSQSLEAQVEAHKREVERYQVMKQDWIKEKAELEKTVDQLKEQLLAMQDWQTPDQDLQTDEVEQLGAAVKKLETERDELVQEKGEVTKKVQDLESKLLCAEKENADLIVSMEELDTQNQAALNQLLEVKKGIQQKFDELSLSYSTLKAQYENLLSTKDEEETKKQAIGMVQEEKEGLQHQLSALRSEFSVVQTDYENLLEKHSDLEADNKAICLKLLSLEAENAKLKVDLDSIHLDHESLQVKYDTNNSENETLRLKLKSLLSDHEVLKSETDQLKSSQDNKAEEHNTSEQSFSDQTAVEKYVIDKLRKIISLEIPEEYYRDIADNEKTEDKELEDQLDMVAALVKMTVDLRWKKETLERNLVDYTRQMRDMSAQLGARDKKIAKLEEECALLRENMESLLDGLNVAPDKGMLPSIPETPEAGEDELVDSVEQQEHQHQQPSTYHNQKKLREEIEIGCTISRLEQEVDILREARSNLEHETERLRGELSELAMRLRSSEAMLRNQDNLEREVGKWREQYERLRRSHQDLENEKASLVEEAEIGRFGLDSLHAEVAEWKAVADSASQEQQNTKQAHEAALAEIAVLKADLSDALNNGVELENTIRTKKLLDQEVEQLRTSVAAMEATNIELQQAHTTIDSLKTHVTHLEENLSILESREKMEEDISSLHQKISGLNTQLEESLKDKDLLNVSLAKRTESLQKLITEKEELTMQAANWMQKYESIISVKDAVHESESSDLEKVARENENLKAEVLSLQNNFEGMTKEFEELSLLRSALQIEVTQLKERLLDSDSDRKKAEDSLQKISEEWRTMNDQLEAMSASKHASELEVIDLRDRLDKALSSQPVPGNQLTDNSAVETLERKMCSMLEEKEQILSVLAEKTRENGILRTENQKLLSALSHSESSQSEEKSVSLDAQIAHLTHCITTLQSEKEQLIIALQAKHNESVQYHAEILRLNEVLTQIQQQQQKSKETESKSLTQEDIEPSVQALQVSSLKTSSGEGDQKVLEEARNLQQKLATLENSLQQERAQNAYLRNEMQEQHEKEGILTRELERLRAHLMEVEESYTAEALRLEEQTRETQVKLTAAEERLRSLSTAHTSASIRANQHVESLQGQSRLIGQQRDELQNKLSAAEDREQRNAAALRNLQAVLEQFQRDKERDLASMTEKLRQELYDARKKHDDLLADIAALKNQLAEAKEGLSAASRLGEQLDRKSETIASLKEQIVQLQEALKGAEERVKNASQSVEGKVDKSLVKNLIVGLLTAPPNSRSPALRVVASVLDFSQDERQRVGLDHSTSRQNEQSLSEAFVRFLESESRPHMALRLLPEASSRSSSGTDGRKDSRTSTSSMGDSPIRRSPLLSEVVLPTFTPLPAGRSSSSILKDVLNSDT